MTDESELSAGEMADRIATKLTTAIVVAGALIASALYWQPSPPRYQAVANGAEVLRIDTRTGTIVSCAAGQCVSLLSRHQHLSRATALPGPPAPAPAAQAPAAPASQAAPAAR
jgi:hypothetical protein